mmetsp:Transcript_4688/g.14288  ORF Transcript_4688/g.14288 Transcript_4688/m.14288 type:complete len:80 (+) Transcript_4688:2734-2973(+)
MNPLFGGVLLRIVLIASSVSGLQHAKILEVPHRRGDEHIWYSAKGGFFAWRWKAGTMKAYSLHATREMTLSGRVVARVL